MQRLEVSGAVRPLYVSLGFKGLKWYPYGNNEAKQEILSRYSLPLSQSKKNASKTRAQGHSKPMTVLDQTFGAGIIFLTLAHSVYKMWIIQEPNSLELWNKLHFEEEKTESIDDV